MNKHNAKDLKEMMDDIADRLRLERISRGYTRNSSLKFWECHHDNMEDMKIKNQKYL